MSRNIGALSNPLQIGDVSGGNYFEVRTDGTKRSVGGATCWKDMVMDLFSKKINSVSGGVDYDWDNNAMKFQSGGNINASGDRVQGNQEINHEFMVGTDIVFRPHIHWFQAVASGVAKAATLTMKYRLQRNGYEMTSAWTTITCHTGTGGDDIFDFTGESDGTYNQLSRLSDITVTCGVSDTLQFQIARTDSSGGDMLVYFFDLHGQVDSDGSDDEIAKAT